MAILRIFQKIENDIWKLTFVNDPQELSDTDRNLMTRFGEPEINVGGTFLGSTGNEFTLPDKYIKIKSGFPYVQEFDAKSSSSAFYTATQTKVEGYRDAIVTEFTNALTTLRTTPDTFTGEKTYTI